MRLENYDIAPDRGFLTPYDMDQIVLPEVFGPVQEAGRFLPGYMTSGRARVFLDEIPEIDMAAELKSLDDAQKRLLMVHYSFIVQAYVWGEAKPAKILPRNLAVPYCILASDYGQFPLLPYSGYTLDNWARFDQNGPISLENIYVLQNFLGGQDEDWFIMVHIEIEAKAADVLNTIPALLKDVEAGDLNAVIGHMEVINNAWDLINPVFDRMPERCDPYIYYNRVRPYIHGWKDNPALPEGLIYAGVEEFGGKPQAFRGQTGSQSSIVPVMDALLGVKHEQDEFRKFLDELHQYRPPGHRKFIEDVQERSTLRDFAINSNNQTLKDLYNSCLDKIQAFRTRHLEYAATYINKQALNAQGNPTDVGTGGTPFMKYLKKHRDESRAHMI